MILNFKTQSLDLATPRIMGILNVTPDSFSDGGEHNTVATAIDHAAKMIAEGADIIDIGGESTRPFATPLSTTQELERVIPVVEALHARFATPLSLDTSTPEVMRAGIAAGADMINDARALQRPGALAMAASLHVPVCLMHSQGEPQQMQVSPHYIHCPAEVTHFLLARAAQCEQAGIARDQLILDPGFGFGKRVQHNYELLASLEHLCTLGYPVLIGLSRKSMIGKVIDAPQVHDRIAASAAAAMLCVERGARIVRVHDVAVTKQMLQVLQAVQNAKKALEVACS
ncbi:MAG: dihydropteroate synthase [Candidatus Anaerobiospirillum merdipullorum]|uniref:Dihydropteroate synthase n=1 Tax=Candidatus Anaerobiospirillum merdipullorum TaxID=2838450 RepID=A0A9E2KNW7_9GAMM|nr:dihydropteroate synthase [Candidatus Anaerobiospirillum merdipullorum]